MKKKIFLLINSLEWGGAERVVVNLAKWLSSYYELDIITIKDAWFYDLPAWVRRISLLSWKWNLKMLLLFPYCIWKFKKILRENQYSSGVSFLEIANFLNIISNKEAIISFRTHISYFKWFIGGVYRFFIKYFYSRAKCIVVNSEENKFDLAHFLNINPTRVQTIYNPLSPPNNLFDPISQSFPEILEANRVIFITVGRLIPEKHHEVILRSLARLRDGCQNLVFSYFIVGDWKNRKLLETLVDELDLWGNVIFTGAIKNVQSYLNISDYFLYASSVEWFPNVLMEAMDSWLPIITSDFKSGARECIFWEYIATINKHQYPMKGPNWILLDFEHFEEQFLKISSSIQHKWSLKTERSGLSKFQPSSVLQAWCKVFK